MTAKFLSDIRIILIGMFIPFLLTSMANAVDIQEVESPSGIKALLVENYNSPLITISFSFTGGSTQDPKGKEGVARFLSTMLDEGAGDLEGQEFQAKAEKLGAEISFRAERDFFTGRLQALSESADEAYEMLRLVLNEPRFDSQPMERMRQSLLVRLKQAETNPNSIASKTLREALFSGHVYERPRAGTIDIITSLTRDDLVNIHRKLFVKDKLHIGVVGAISAEQLSDVLDRVFSSLPESSKQDVVAEAMPEFGKTHEKTADIPQSIITFALPGMKRSDPEFFAGYLVNHILGGGTFSSRLYDEVREKRGLAYSVYSQLATYSYGSATMVGLSTSAERTSEAIRIVRQELKKMAENGPTLEELAAAKKYIIGSYAIRNLDTSPKVAGVLVAIQQAKLGKDYIERREDIINSVTLEDVKKAAARLLKHEPTLVIVGPEGKI